MARWLYTRGMEGVPTRFRPTLFGPGTDPRRIAAAARLLGRRVRATDMFGFQREVIAATEPAPGRSLAYVESRAREDRGSVDVAFHLLVREPGGAVVAGCELESYNPYFGCDVGYLDWRGDAAVLVYQEKHRTYVCRVRPGSPTRFEALSDDWVVSGDAIGHHREGEGVVRQLGLPDLAELPPVSSGCLRPVGRVVVDPRWRTADVVGLVRGIYQDRTGSRMPLLADALMDAGCDDPDLLDHCRGGGPHFRACWVLGLLLRGDGM